MNIIDRRLNPKGKSLANRQRFLRRAKEQVIKAVRTAAGERRITDIESGDAIVIPNDGLREPGFHRSHEGGVRDHVLPGNKEYMPGDLIPRPEGGAGGGGSEGSPHGDGEDDFRFELSKEEFLDIFLEDLELPDLVKKKVKRSASYSLTRAGYSVTGSPSNLNLVRTMRNSLGRRIALRRPRASEIAEIEAEIARLEEELSDDPGLLEMLHTERERMLARAKLIPYIDPIDVRYNRFESVPKPITQAVMFCLMDVSGSMTEHMKDLAKRFFMLLYLFLTRRYEHVDIVFIRHTHEAKEVDEDTFFYSTDTGGTVVSTALSEMKKVVSERYTPADWNIYAAQASDGDNTSTDNARSAALLEHVILPLCQYFAYIEVGSEHKEWRRGESDLWRTYKTVENRSGILAMRRVRNRSEIFPVFHELFSRDRATTA